jgi:transposase
VIDDAQLQNLNAPQLREVVRSLMTQLQQRDSEIVFKQAVIDKITHEMAVLKRLKFAAKSEPFNLEQKSLLEEATDADLQALQCELEQLEPQARASCDKRQPKREKLPENLPRREIRHEPQSTTCTCGCALKRIGEDVAEKLDYQPGVFSVERHVRGKWVCTKCQTLVQAPVAAHIIDKGIPTTGLLAQVLVAKYVDHQPLYRQEHIFGRAGLALPRSTLGQWVGACGVQLQPLVDALKQELLRHSVLHADETPVAMLKPGNGKTHRAYLWSYCTTAFEATKAVVFDFADSRAGRHAKEFLGPWRGALVCDDYSGYKALFGDGVSEAGCLAHARRKFYDLWANHKSQIAAEALALFARLYEVEQEVQQLNVQERQRIRQQKSRPWADALQASETGQSGQGTRTQRAAT